MAKPSVVDVLPEEVVELDSIENQTQAFLVAMKDILDTQCRMMMDKDNYVERRRIERIVLPKGFKIISS
tara:strand:+ start:287 stop:493 length:207 start_codon:yes stop_codon:yes gene_type:complete